MFKITAGYCKLKLLLGNTCPKVYWGWHLVSWGYLKIWTHFHSKVHLEFVKTNWKYLPCVLKLVNKFESSIPSKSFSMCNPGDKTFHSRFFLDFFLMKRSRKKIIYICIKSSSLNGKGISLWKVSSNGWIVRNSESNNLSQVQTK